MDSGHFSPSQAYSQVSSSCLMPAIATAEGSQALGWEPLPLLSPRWRAGPWPPCYCRSPASHFSSTASSPSSPRCAASGIYLPLCTCSCSTAAENLKLFITSIVLSLVLRSGAESFRMPSSSELSVEGRRSWRFLRISSDLCTG
jgi:hypothetical protein